MTQALCKRCGHAGDSHYGHRGHCLVTGCRCSRFVAGDADGAREYRKGRAALLSALDAGATSSRGDAQM